MVRERTRILRENILKVQNLAAKINEFPLERGFSEDDFASHHYPHIARDIAHSYANHLHFAFEFSTEGDHEKEAQELVCAQEAEKTLNLYLGLLEQFPEYALAEFTTEEGFFPGLDGDYIKESARLLRKNFTRNGEVLMELRNLSLVEVANDILTDYEDGHGPLIDMPISPNYKRLCPFHEETNPSFWVWPESNRYLCHGCSDEGGPVMLTIKLLGWEKGFDYLAEKTSIERQELLGARLWIEYALAGEDRFI